MLTAIEARLATTPITNAADHIHNPAILAPDPEPSRHPAAPQKGIPRAARSRLGLGMLMAGLVTIPWVFILARTLPSTITAAHWSTAWAGLDSLEAAGLIATGVGLIRHSSWLCLPAAVTATLLAVDAWFDIVTSAPGSAAAMAVALAVFPEFPMAGLCMVLATRSALGRA